MSEWQPIETAPNGELLMYFPSERTKRGDYRHIAMIKVDRFPVSYPRQPTHWMPLPSPPEKIESGANAAADSPAPDTASNTTTRIIAANGVENDE